MDHLVGIFLKTFWKVVVTEYMTDSEREKLAKWKKKWGFTIITSVVVLWLLTIGLIFYLLKDAMSNESSQVPSSASPVNPK